MRDGFATVLLWRLVGIPFHFLQQEREIEDRIGRYVISTLRKEVMEPIGKPDSVNATVRSPSCAVGLLSAGRSAASRPCRS
jgi:hypothetical protein